MTAITTTHGGQLAAPTRGPGRPLGLRAEPTLRLAIGYRDETKRGAPVKLDHFLAKPGPDGAHAAAARKFHDVYGPEPKAIDVRLPGELGQALVVRHMAWSGSGGDEGGSLKAVGRANFATLGVMGGPDVLTVWRPDGQVDEVDVTGVDDPAAVELGVELYTTFRFHLPRVLGLGAMAEITSKGQKTTDNLYARLVELYQMLGSRVSFAVEPKLVVRRSSARPRVVNKKTGEVTRIKSTIYVLDLVVPESIDEMLDRLAQRQQLLYGGRPAAELLYGSPPANGAAGPAPVGDPDGPPVDVGDAGEVEEAVEGEYEDEDEDGGAGDFAEPEPSPYEPPADDGAVREAQAAGLVQVGFGKHKGRTIEQISQDDPGYVGWLCRTEPSSPRGHEVQAAARAYAAVYLTGTEQ